MSHASRQKSQRIESLGLQRLLGGTAAFRDIAQDHRETDMFDRRRCAIAAISTLVRFTRFDDQRDDVEIDEAVGRIEDFHVATERPAALSERAPVQASNAFAQLFADGIGPIQAEQFTGGIVQVSDSTARIGDDDSFLDGVKNGFEKAFLLGQAQEIILDIFRADPAEPTDKLFDKARFHAAHPVGAA